MSRHLHRLDAQLVAGEPLEIAFAAAAAPEWLRQRELRSAGATARASRDLDDLEQRAFRHRVLRRHVEAKAQRVGEDGRELADLEHDAPDPGALTRLGGDL